MENDNILKNLDNLKKNVVVLGSKQLEGASNFRDSLKSMGNLMHTHKYKFFSTINTEVVVVREVNIANLCTIVIAKFNIYKL